MDHGRRAKTAYIAPGYRAPAPAPEVLVPALGSQKGCATSASLTNHPGHGPTTGHALTFTPDHPMGPATSI